MKLNERENHKTLSSFEHSLIFKIFGFQFFNTFNSFFMIAFLEDYFGGQSSYLCYMGQKDGIDNFDCFDSLSNRVRTVFLVSFATNIPEIMGPVIKTLLKKRKIEGGSDKPQSEKHPFSEIDQMIMD